MNYWVMMTAIVGGFLWMESTFARVDQLEYLLQEKFAKIKLLEQHRCQLFYTIKRERAEIELKALEADISELEATLRALLRPATRDEARIAWIEGSLPSLNNKESDLGEKRQCLIGALQSCFTGDTNINKCG